MRKIHLVFALIFTSLFSNCIGEDIIDDAVPEEIRFLNPIDNISVSETYQLDVSFLNNIGEVEAANVIWSSSNPSIATINSTGLITPIAEGTTTISAVVNLSESKTVENAIDITITEAPIEAPIPEIKSGTIVTTSSYLLKGDFTLTAIENSNNLNLSIESNYEASTSLPGLYLYLSNNPNSISSAYEVGAVNIFNGAHSYTIVDAGLNDYAYLLYWCKPFAVKVGEGEIND